MVWTSHGIHSDIWRVAMVWAECWVVHCIRISPQVLPLRRLRHLRDRSWERNTCTKHPRLYPRHLPTSVRTDKVQHRGDKRQLGEAAGAEIEGPPVRNDNQQEYLPLGSEGGFPVCVHRHGSHREWHLVCTSTRDVNACS